MPAPPLHNFWLLVLFSYKLFLFPQALSNIFHTHMPCGGDICVNERQGPDSVAGSPPKTEEGPGKHG